MEVVAAGGVTKVVMANKAMVVVMVATRAMVVAMVGIKVTKDMEVMIKAVIMGVMVVDGVVTTRVVMVMEATEMDMEEVCRIQRGIVE